jgi:hypothetical protein
MARKTTGRPRGRPRKAGAVRRKRGRGNGPTPERRQHDGIEYAGVTVDDAGEISEPYRVVDQLVLLERSGLLMSPEMRLAGEAFRVCFRRARLDRLQAQDPSRPVIDYGHVPDGAAGDPRARGHIAVVMRRLGGDRSPPASALWATFGLGHSLERWGRGTAGSGRDGGGCPACRIGGLIGSLILTCSLQ